MKIEEVKKYTWYRQGFDGSMFFIFVPYSTAFDFFGRENVFMAVEGKHGKGYWTKECIWPLIEHVFINQKKDKVYADKMVSTWEMIEKKKHDLAKRFGSIDAMDAKHVEMFMKHFVSIDFEQWRAALYPDIFDTVDEEALAREFQKANVVIDQNDLKILLQPLVLPFNSQLELELLKIAILPVEQVKVKLKEITAKYFFLRSDWAHVEILDETYFFDLMKRYCNQDVDKRIKELEGYTQKRKTENTKILHKYKIPYDIQNLFYLFQRLARFRDDRKLAMQYSNYLLHQVAKRIEAISGIRYEDIMFLTPDEALHLLKGKDHSKILSHIAQRKDFSFIAFENDIFKEYVGEEARAVHNVLLDHFKRQFPEIKGQTGNKGNAKGPARILKGRQDFSKFQDGDVLVAPMTRPEYVPLMEKASAIVTDEGGITCHAAIVSRELGKPCIIGTQVATEVLNDGEIVEVDADNGIIRKAI